MLLVDVNVFIYAHREDAANHARFRDWLTEQLDSRASFGFSEQILSSVVRIVTHPGIYADPTRLEHALKFVGRVRSSPHTVLVQPGRHHWEIFTGLCETISARGNMISDCYHAALAIEHGCEWITADRHFARFPGLRWRHPLD